MAKSVRNKRRRGCFGCFPIIGLAFLILLGAIAYYMYKAIFKDNVKGNEDVALVIPKDSSLDQVVDLLKQNDILNNTSSFVQIAKIKEYNNLVKPGKYLIKSDWGNNELINHLRLGNQVPVRFVINNARTPQDLSGIVAKQLDIDSLEMLEALKDPSNADKYGFTKATFPAMFLANTYEMYWNTSIDGFMDRMNKEYNRYWTTEKEEKANALGLNREEVITLASIVEEETKVPSELPIVAGLYLNRLRRGIPLQADPTVKYAVGDFSLKRILNKHLEVDSPYNTYKYSGLPPGPIRIPELNAVNAVLNPKSHDFIYMCAKSDFSGEHAFAKTLAAHNRNAAEYHNALNAEGIR